MAGSLSSLESEGVKFRVAICGCGITGLILAITIGKYDPSIPIDLYEAHKSVETTGAGITLQRHEVLTELGLLDEFKEIFTNDTGRDIEGPKMRRSDIREGGYTWYQVTYRHTTSTMHRQHMIAILEKHLPASCTVHLGKRLVNYVEPEEAYSKSPIRLEFMDGTSAITDVLIGADGVRSAVRKTFFELASKGKDGGDNFKQYAEAAFTGVEIYRYLIPTESLSEENPKNFTLSGPTSYNGKGKCLMTYPIAKGTIINCAAITYNPGLNNTNYEGGWVSNATRDELVELFDDFEPDARTIIKLCKQPSKWALHVVKPLPFCVRNKVALIGDACHAMAPFLAAGGGQGISDAFMLGRLIAHPLTSLSRIQDILRIYEEIRLPVAREVAKLSLSNGWLISFMEPGWYDGAREEDGVDEMGIGVYEREGMESIKKEAQRRFAWMGELRSDLQSWEDAELKLRALVN